MLTYPVADYMTNIGAQAYVFFYLAVEVRILDVIFTQMQTNYFTKQR